MRAMRFFADACDLDCRFFFVIFALRMVKFGLISLGLDVAFQKLKKNVWVSMGSLVPNITA